MIGNPCGHCGEPIKRPKRVSTAHWKKRKFCNDACYRAASMVVKDFTCERCGQAFTKQPRGRTRKPRFCSHACSVKGRPLGPKTRYRKVGGVLAHRAAMERILGRPLRDFEEVHHKNGRREDNSDGNLELWCVPQPAGQRVEDLIDWLVENYAYEVSVRLGHAD